MAPRRANVPPAVTMLGSNGDQCSAERRGGAGHVRRLLTIIIKQPITMISVSMTRPKSTQLRLTSIASSLINIQLPRMVIRKNKSLSVGLLWDPHPRGGLILFRCRGPGQVTPKILIRHWTAPRGCGKDDSPGSSQSWQVV